MCIWNTLRQVLIKNDLVKLYTIYTYAHFYTTQTTHAWWSLPLFFSCNRFLSPYSHNTICAHHLLLFSSPFSFPHYTNFSLRAFYWFHLTRHTKYNFKKKKEKYISLILKIYHKNSTSVQDKSRKVIVYNHENYCISFPSRLC